MACIRLLLITVKAFTFFHETGRDNLLHHKGQAFSTYDSDHDNKVNGNCAVIQHSAWWFTDCVFCDLNAPIIHWGHLPGGQYHIKYTEMKLRPM
ncbi:Fibrinogen C domain-containing protein 1-B [Holothuria leucospilota]|uniref:Fibrinogen C domain-containing protein 1-B n=1 Tax=Holothuria leucospilota TaxID=206669 RepID=A0A9Q0YK87_HOLLE|nr:Fibrinogen C domain-containing protein 1-B [Holothuria leucospilota]